MKTSQIVSLASLAALSLAGVLYFGVESEGELEPVVRAGALAAPQGHGSTAHASHGTAAGHGHDDHGAGDGHGSGAHTATGTQLALSSHPSDFDLGSESSPLSIWTRLVAGNRRFVTGATDPRAVVERRADLVSGQRPQVIVLGCADSRVGPELVFDQNLGDLFVVRTAGNIADEIAIGSIEYAVEHLHSRLIVVLGHEKCGAVAAAASGQRMPTKNLQAIVDQIEPSLAFLRVSLAGDDLVTRGVDANVHQSARHLIESSPILSQAVAAREITVVKAKYSLATGQVIPLQ